MGGSILLVTLLDSSVLVLRVGASASLPDAGEAGSKVRHLGGSVTISPGWAGYSCHDASRPPDSGGIFRLVEATSLVRDRRARRKPFALFAALAAIVLIAGVASAHDTWLITDSGRAAVGERVVLRLTSGMAFPQDDFAVDAARVLRASVRIRDSARALPRPRSAPQALRYEWTPRVEGIATAGVELAPRTLVLEPDKIEEYLGEIDATAEIRQAWASLGGRRKWVESYAKHAKTLVRVGNPVADSSWSRPLGLALELVPQRDPTTLRAGDTLTLLVLHRDRPLAGLAVGAIREGTTAATFARTDARGRARVALPAAGRWLLNGTLLRRSSDPKLVWESDFTTLTLIVGR